MDDTQFQQALEVYRTNYLEYKVTGRSEYKEAYLRAQAIVEQYLANLRKKIGNDASYVDGFVRKYADSNKRLTRLRDQSRAIQREGPILQDEYDVKKRLNETSAVSVDYSPYYVKGAIIAGVAGIAYVASLLR